MATTEIWLLTGALFLLGLVIWAFGSEMTAAIGAVLGVALALFVAFIVLVYIAAVGAPTRASGRG